MNQDEAAVRQLREHAAKGVSASFVKYVKGKPEDLVEPIRAELGKGNTVVIQDYEVPKPYMFSESHVLRQRRLNRNRLYDIHCTSEYYRILPPLILCYRFQNKIGQLHQSPSAFDAWQILRGCGR